MATSLLPARHLELRQPAPTVRQPRPVRPNELVSVNLHRVTPPNDPGDGGLIVGRRYRYTSPPLEGANPELGNLRRSRQFERTDDGSGNVFWL